MKKALFTLLLTAGLSGFADAATVTLASGQWIQLNFAPASTTTTDADLAAGFNSFQTNNNTTNAITSSNTLINSAGDIISGVTMDAISGWNALGGSGAWNYTGQTLAGNANWTSQETTTFVWSNTKVDAKVALGGLDSSLTYNVYIYSKLSGIGQDSYSININGMTESLTASVRNTRLAVNTPDFTFSGVTVGTDKKLDITWQYPGSNASWNPFVNAIVIEVIPEPSTYAFAGVGALLALGAVVLRRRK